MFKRIIIGAAIILVFAGCATIRNDKLQKIIDSDKIVHVWVPNRAEYLIDAIDIYCKEVKVGSIYQSQEAGRLAPLVFEYSNGQKVLLWNIGDYSRLIKVTQSPDDCVLRVFYWSGLSFSHYNMNEFNIQTGKVKQYGLPKWEKLRSRLSEKEALSIAMKVIEEKWPGESKLNLPYHAEFSNDVSEGIWIIRGTLPRNCCGGTALIFIDDTNGEVFKVYHEQ